MQVGLATSRRSRTASPSPSLPSSMERTSTRGATRLAWHLN
ncbi:UNVERIFIED_CONTAM: hypothetical protein GTU68_018266 [Idotea baltica]|nr:hypothetical protein [Idotea baltica]